MKVDIDNLRAFHARGKLIQHTWGDARETACMLSALTGATSDDGCVAAGWPLWLSEAGHCMYDACAPSESWDFALRFAAAVRDADARSVDWDEVFCAFRRDSVLPIAFEALGDGDEPWRTACRDVVRSVLDSGNSAEAARAAWAARAARAAGAAEAARAARADWAAGAAEAAAWARMRESLLRVIEAAP